MSIIGNALNQNLTNGQLSIGSTGAPAVASTLTAGTNISITNGAGSITIAAVGTAFAMNIQTFNASGTYTPTAGMTYCIIEAVGGGGGSGGCATTSSVQVAASGGGGGGQYLRNVFSAATIGTSQTVTIGAAGTAGTAGNNNGGNGGSSSVGSLIVASGGNGGGGSAATGSAQTTTGGTGGSSGTALFTLSGLAGEGGVAVFTATAYSAVGGSGGSSHFGTGGPSQIRIAISGGNSVGRTGGIGSGAGGSINTISCPDTAGAAGGIGIVVITEFGIGGTNAFAWRVITGTTQAIAIGNGYIANNGSLTTLTLPSTANVGDMFAVTGIGAGGWKVAQNASQSIQIEGNVTTTGTGGSLASTIKNDSVTIVCTTANTGFLVVNFVGNITYV